MSFVILNQMYFPIILSLNHIPFTKKSRSFAIIELKPTL
jgi:hypothetical protein